MSSTDFESHLRLADRIAAIQHKHFVGRKSELELFRTALLESEPHFAVLHLYGPGGIGKTTLLNEFARSAWELNIPTLLLDGRNLNPSPTEFLLSLRLAMGLEGETSPLDTLAEHPRSVVLIDTYEMLTSLDSWLLDMFLPQMPESCLVVIAGRNPPTSGWRTAPGWRDLVRIISLRNLHPDESQLYLNIRGLAETQYPSALEFTHGHPLALALVADVVEQNNSTFDPEREPDVVRVLLEQFLRYIPSPRHREALEICALVRSTTEALLADVLNPEMGHEIFAWLRDLSFTEQNAQGLFPHDLAREVLVADLRWRNPDGFRQRYHQVRNHMIRRMRESTGRAQQQACFDYLYMQRVNPQARLYLDLDTFGSVYAAPVRVEDHQAILAMVRHHEGEVSAEIAHYWLQRQPQAFTMFYTADQQPAGFLANLIIDVPTREDLKADPAIQPAWSFVQRHRALRPGEVISYKRFWMGREIYQISASDIFSMVAMISINEWLANPNLAWSFAAYIDPDYWYPSYGVVMNFQRSTEADFEIDGRYFGVFTHDWRVEPLLDWLVALSDRALANGFEPYVTETTPVSPLIVLSESEFADAVRQALRDYTRPELLAANPLLRSRLVTDRNEAEVRPAALNLLIHEAADSLKNNPKDAKLYHALHRTYFDPAPTQEAAAELLDLPFSTYRYHLTNGIRRITEWLWQRELYGFQE